uniref:HEAT repeat-containing protein 1 n=1 Tax=Pygocentrus nattereri TaxID=42514 RepID=A0AAR2KP96_PYGNA
MTSLAHQLKRLALPQNAPEVFTRRETISLLFDPKHAATLDKDNFYALGCTGLEELLGIEPAFAEFQETLFGAASVHLERGVQSKEVNQKLDKSISLFLTRLSPYFLLKPALKCLEWLIHRFHIHLYNQDSLIACVLPYHDTKLFVRVIQLLKIDDPTHKWHWLHGLQKPGVPLARGTLLTHCYKDLDFMDFICTMVTKSVKAYSAFVRDGRCAQLRVVFSFYAAAIVPALEAVEKVTDSIVAKLLPYVQLGLKSELVDYKAATYMIVSQLAVKVVMQAELVNTLAVQMSRSLGRGPALTSEGLSCLIVLLQNQKEGVVGPKPFGYLCAVHSLVPSLQTIAASYDVSPLLRYLLPHLIHSVITQNGNYLKTYLPPFICCMLFTLWMFFSLLIGVCRLLLEEYVSCGAELGSDGVSSLNQKIQPVVRLFEHKYPGALDAVLEAHVSEMNSDQQKNLLHQFLSLTMSCGKYQLLADSDTSLMLSLNHPLSSVRNLALDHLKNILASGQEGFDKAFLKDALLERIKDDAPEVVLSALSALQVLVYCSLLQCGGHGCKVCKRCCPCRCAVLKEAVRTLNDSRLSEVNADLRARIIWELLPFLVVTNPELESTEMQLMLCVSEMHLLTKHPLTQGWSDGTNKISLSGSDMCCVLSGDRWWNPVKLDTSTCYLIHIMGDLAGNNGKVSKRSFSAVCVGFQEHLSEPEHLFKFLSLLWCYSNNLGDQLEVGVSALLQTRALYVGKALLTTVPSKSLSLLASASSPVVPSLLACLTFGVGEVRRAALAVFQTLSTSVTSSPYSPLMEKLLSVAEELIADPTYLSQVTHHHHAPNELKHFFCFFVSLQSLLSFSVSCPPTHPFLHPPPPSHPQMALSVLLPAVERLLEQFALDPSVFLLDEALLLQLLLEKYNEASAVLLSRDSHSLELFITALRTSSRPYPNIASFQIIALEQITKPFFAALGDEKIQQRILGVLFDLLVVSKNPACSQTISSVFKGIAVDAELVANELTPVDKPRVTGSIQQTRRSKVQPKKAQDVPPEESTVSWPRVTLILELLQHKKKLKRPQMLVPALFNLLSRYVICLELSAEQENVEYTKQLLLSVLLNVCQRLSPQGGPISKDILDEDKFSVELVVQCVRTSSMPQTHHHALLLLGTVAGIFPEKVLHNIMPIFTFMGANIMRLDDTYSFQVISRTVQTVIPALIQKTVMGAVVTRIVQVFVDALPHVPDHRRLPILKQLLDTLGPAHFLWVLLLLLFKQHTSLSATGAEKEAALERDLDFWILVCCGFEVHEQLTSFIKILQFLMTLGLRREKKEENVSQLIFSVETHSGKELRHFKFLSMSFMAQLLVADLLLEENLRYIHTVAQCVEENTDKPTAKFWRALLTKSYDMLDKVNALLPTDTFITVVRGLMGNQLASVRRKAMELLNNRLQQKRKWAEQQVAVLLELTGDLLVIVGHGRVQAGGQEEEEQAINRQTAIYSLKLLCRSFGAGHQEVFLPVLSRMVELVANPEEEKNVMGSALLCVAEVTNTLKALAIPQIHRLMPAILQTLQERKDLLSNEVYLLSAVTALQRTAETLPHFISPYLEATILQVTRLTQVAERLSSCPQLAVRLSSLSSTLATKVPPRVLLPTLAKCYGSMVDSLQNRIGPLMNILKEHIGHLEKEQLTSHQSELTSFFLSALDFRSKHCQGDLEKTAEIEGCVIDCLLAMVMKLSEVTFRPLFFKLFDWCKTEGAAKDRMLTFCRLADSIADRLKGLFVLFAGQLVKPFSDMLRKLNAAQTDEAFFDSEEEEDDDNVSKSCLLLQYILDCLRKIFLYDTQRFLSKERADALLGPLVDQVENMLGGEQVYQTRITQHLVPCVAQFSVAMGDDSQWKVLNYQILLKTRHRGAGLAGKLKENYMVLLPETIPFLAELMEDECEEVEHQVQKVIREMETVLGEPLQSYF